MKEIHHEVWIQASKEDVFEAITSQQGLDSWWGPALNGAPELGYVVEFDHGLGAPLRMRIADIVPNERLEWECISEFQDPGNPASEWRGHRLSFDLSAATDDASSAALRERIYGAAADDITILHFRQAGWADDARWYGFCNGGWGSALETLRAHSEGAAARRAAGEMEQPPAVTE